MQVSVDQGHRILFVNSNITIMSIPKEKHFSTPAKVDSFTSEGTDYFSSEKSDSLMLESPEEYEQNCLLFPTYATKHDCNEDGIPTLTDNWNIRIRGWAFSTPRSSKTRALFLIVGLTKPNKMALDGDPNDLPVEHSENFMTETGFEDSYQHHHENTNMGGDTYKTPVVSNSGSFSGDIVIRQSTVEKWLKEGGDHAGNLLKLEVYQNEDSKSLL
ncbi:2005_t:CDS:2 [Acaulospora colombiana]|uniref:2005_t:CDS:1 n=1 Tax=Acaulospora colombiana TaxID=27376 RepID=A0ACA9LVT8_9GLOM|nr:2005_t:CDS:2 [Acaulospora colombiana]